jgi:hypothetical protein
MSRTSESVAGVQARYVAEIDDESECVHDIETLRSERSSQALARRELN